MGIYSEAIQRLYVAYFNRPADPGGVAYWDKAIAAANGSLAAVSAAFAASGEYKAAYAGMDASHVVNQVYLNLFGHGADAAGLDFWTKALVNKQMTIDNAVTQIASGAQGADLVAFNSKTSAASAFTNALQTTTLVLAYTGDNANQIGKFFLSSIIDDATLQAAIAPDALQRVMDGLGGGTPWPLVHVGTSPAGGFDASLLNPVYGAIDLVQDGVVIKVGSQTLLAHGNLTATAAGYDGAGVYGGSLKVSETASGTLTANADGLALTVQATGADVAASIAGDIRSASVKLGGDDAGHGASLAVSASGSALANLQALTMSGSGAVSISNAAGSSLATVDASQLAAPGGLTYSSTSTVAETIRLGIGVDHVTLGASTYAGMDTIYGLRLVLNSAGTALAASSDTLAVTGIAASVKVFATARTDLDLALMEAAASSKGDDLVFVMNGDTYIYHDTGANNLVDFGDIVVKLAGVTDLKAVIIALGGTPS